MHLDYQQPALDQFKQYVDSNIHSIILSGFAGVGKTYISREFAKMHNISTFQVIQPKVQDIRESIDQSLRSSDRQVLCIENLDLGAFNTMGALLKYLEEPTPNVYIVVTCRNSAKLPNTILSRGLQITLNHPTFQDICNYAKHVNNRYYEVIREYNVFKQVKSLSEVDELLDLSLDKIQYYELAESKLFGSSKLSIDQIIWGLNHFEDNSKCDPSWILKLICNVSSNDALKQASLKALIALEDGKISESAILGNLVFSIL